jgi:hypothetical protein
VRFADETNSDSVGKPNVKRFLILLILPFMPVLTAGCSSPGSPPKSSVPELHPTVDKYQVSEISYERSGSWGVPYGYKVVLRADGSAEYFGEARAERAGKYRGSIEKNKFDQLATLIIQKDFLSRKDYYTSGRTDTETVTTSVIYSGGRKTVRNHGRGGDDEIGEIEQAIKSAIAQIPWEKDKG